MNKRKRLIEQQRRKQNKHYDWRQTYYFALNCYAMSRATGKSRECQHQFGIYAIRPAIGMRYNYGYTFSMFREDIRRRTEFWKLALSKKKIDLETLQLLKYVNFRDKQEAKLGNRFLKYKVTLKQKGYEGYTIYQSVFPCDIEHKEFLRKQPKNRFKGYFKRLRKAERLKKAGKKNWQSFEPKESEL